MPLIPKCRQDFEGKTIWWGEGRPRQTSHLQIDFFFLTLRNLISSLVHHFTIEDKCVRKISPYLLVKCKYMTRATRKERRGAGLCTDTFFLCKNVSDPHKGVLNTHSHRQFTVNIHSLNPYLQAIISQRCHVSVSLCGQANFKDLCGAYFSPWSHLHLALKRSRCFKGKKIALMQSGNVRIA